MGEGEYVRVTISMPRSLLEEVKRACKRHGYTQSELFRVAVRRFLSSLERGGKR